MFWVIRYMDETVKVVESQHINCDEGGIVFYDDHTPEGVCATKIKFIVNMRIIKDVQVQQ